MQHPSHWNLCIEISVDQQEKKILQEESYFIFPINDYTRMTWVNIMKNKFEAF